jgi:hypothetical protein
MPSTGHRHAGRVDLERLRPQLERPRVVMLGQQGLGEAGSW